MVGVVNRVVVAADENLQRRLGTHAQPQRLGGIARQCDRLGTPEPAELGLQELQHGGETGGAGAAGVLVAPTDEKIAQLGSAFGQGGDGVGQRHVI